MMRRAEAEGLPDGFSSRPSAITTKGQATIPAEIRREMGLEPGDKVVFSVREGRVVLDKAQAVDEDWNRGQSAMLCEWDDPEQDIYND